MDRQAELPRGIWAIGSDLCGGEEASRWAGTAAVSQALTLRRPHGSGTVCLAAAKALRDVHRFLAIHGHADLALAVEADAVIAGVRSLPLPVYAARFPRLLRGASTHSLEEAQWAHDQGADFLIYGPIWETPEKRGILKPCGFEGFSQITALGLPTVVIGGIESAAHVKACLDAGAYGCAVLRAAKNQQQLTELVAATR